MFNFRKEIDRTFLVPGRKGAYNSIHSSSETWLWSSKTPLYHVISTKFEGKTDIYIYILSIPVD